MLHNFCNTLKEFESGTGTAKYYSLPQLGQALSVNISRLPISIRIILESVLRNYDEEKISETHIRSLANWVPNANRVDEIPFRVSRVILQDFTGVPLLCDIASMRDVVNRMGYHPKIIEPLIPVDLVIDHSVQIDYFGHQDALDLNMKLEFSRNRERYQFMKWGMQAFKTFKITPPGRGIIHQINLEYLAPGVHKKIDQKDIIYYPDSVVGTDSHTTMVNGIGVVGWGVGGIEAEASMLGQPVYFLTPDVVGIELIGTLSEGITATDLVLTITEILRDEKVVGKFVEFFGTGSASLTVPDRATIANMAPEYGATMGFFPIDEKTIKYFQNTGRPGNVIDTFEQYFKAQEMFGMPLSGQIDYTKVLTLDLSSITTSVSGPKRPQDRIKLGNVKQTFKNLFSKPHSENGFAKEENQFSEIHRTTDGIELKNGDILIAAITSCTNTSNPSVMLRAGLLAKKAVEHGLTVAPHIKTSIAPGSRTVTNYLVATGLLAYLEKLGFAIAAYGCTTCIGNGGDLTQILKETIIKKNLITAAVLSGNRNFEARIHPNIHANFLVSPPLVIAYAIAGSIKVDLSKEPVGRSSKGYNVFLSDIWPSNKEVDGLMKFALDASVFHKSYSKPTFKDDLWSKIDNINGNVYNWPESTYIAKPPFFSRFQISLPILPISIRGARALGIFGDSFTTDHISPAGAIKENSPAGIYLKEKGVQKENFNSYGSRRGNHEIMTRGTFANVRIKNLIIPPKKDGSLEEGGLTIYQPTGDKLSIYDAAIRYISVGIPTIIFAGEEYGTGSSRDWAAKGTLLLGVKAVIARSFERIHRSNLVGMGILPIQFKENDSIQSLEIKGNETFDIEGIESHNIYPKKECSLFIHRANGKVQKVGVQLRIDTHMEVDYYKHGGILPYVLRSLLS